MKTLTAIFVIACAAFITSAASAQDTTIVIKTSAQCESCQERIQNALAFEKGVKSAKLDLNTKEVTVVYDKKKSSPEKLRKAVAKAGYDADGVPANEKAYKKLPKCCQKGGHN